MPINGSDGRGFSHSVGGSLQYFIHRRTITGRPPPATISSQIHIDIRRTTQSYPLPSCASIVKSGTQAPHMVTLKPTEAFTDIASRGKIGI